MNNYEVPGLCYCLSQVREAAFMGMVLRRLCWIKGNFKGRSDEIQHLSQCLWDQHLYPVVMYHLAPSQRHPPRVMRSTKRAGGGLSSEENSAVSISPTFLFSCAGLFLMDVSVLWTSLRRLCSVPGRDAPHCEMASFSSLWGRLCCTLSGR